eukprot:GFUD01052110.1.p1 GENE.GFUD01052110.1~~GFUD01052110.1.p1  ORF type:complete len:471 (+),score=111.97 GFUD01052110.1:301-1713(+)
MKMVAEQNLRYDQGYAHDIDSRSPPPTMMLQDTKFFPGHPASLAQPYSPSFGRKDIFNQRKQREFIPENKKDDSYWDRRRRNNEAAKRSREKRRLNDMLLETRVIELSKDNHILKAQLNAIFEKYGIKGENMVSMDQVMSTMPSNDQVLQFTKKRLGPMPGMRESSPSPLSFSSLGLPISINNNNGSNNNNSTSRDLNRSCSPERDMSSAHSYRSRSPSPSPTHYHSSMPQQPPLATPSYNDIRSYTESGHMYRRPVSEHEQRYEEDRDSEKDSGLALNLSTDRGGSEGTRDESGRSSASGSPPVTSSNIQDGNSSGDESGYPRSPNSGSATSGDNSSLPHKLRFKSAVSEKEAVSSLLSLHQMAMIKREPVEHINHWMETAGSGLTHAGLLASLLPQNSSHFTSIDQERVEENGGIEPSRKRLKLPMGPIPENIKDEVARLTSEVATLKNILVNRMKDEEGDEEEREEN